MTLKSWFGGRGKGGGRAPESEQHSIDDLIVLERYQEAADRLLAKLKQNQQDLHSHLKLAEVYTHLQQIGKAVDEYVFVAEEYAQDGFYDKGIALLSRASKLAPNDGSLRERIAGQQREKSLDHVRVLAIEGLRQAGSHLEGTSALELQRLWHNVVGSTLVQNLGGEPLKRLFSAMHLHHLEADKLLVRAGSDEPFMLFLARGTVEATTEIAGAAPGAAPVRHALRAFGPGDILGEAALLERGRWPADYWVREAASVLRLTRDGLEKCLVGNSDPRGFLEILRGQHNDRDVNAAVASLRGSR